MLSLHFPCTRSIWKSRGFCYSLSKGVSLWVWDLHVGLQVRLFQHLTGTRKLLKGKRKHQRMWCHLWFDLSSCKVEALMEQSKSVWLVVLGKGTAANLPLGEHSQLHPAAVWLHICRLYHLQSKTGWMWKQKDGDCHLQENLTLPPQHEESSAAVHCIEPGK